jgi:hypothetical protein
MSTTIRDKFIEHMAFSGLAKQTQRSYITGVKGLAYHHNQSPETLTNDRVRAYFRHLLLERKLAWASCGAYLPGIKYFFRHICNREVDDRFGVPLRPRSRNEQGKGRKDRYTVLSEKLLWELREYWRKYTPDQWHFPGQKPDSHIPSSTVSSAMYAAKR